MIEGCARFGGGGLIGLHLLGVEHRHGGLGGQRAYDGAGPGEGHIRVGFAAHGDVSLPDGAARNDRNLGASRGGIGVEQLALRVHQPALVVQLIHLHAAGVHKADHRQVEAIHKMHKPGGLLQRAGGQVAGGSRHHAYRAAADAAHHGTHAGFIRGLELQHRARIQRLVQKRIHVGGVHGGQQTVQIIAVHQIRILGVAAGQQRKHASGQGEGFVLIGGHQRAGALLGHQVRAAQRVDFHVHAVHGGQHLRAKIGRAHV